MATYNNEEKDYITKKLDELRSKVVSVSNSKVNVIVKDNTEWDTNGTGAVKQVGYNAVEASRKSEINYLNRHLTSDRESFNKATDINKKNLYARRIVDTKKKIAYYNSPESNAVLEESCRGNMGLNCITNVTDNYKKAGAINKLIPGNMTFSAEAKNLGFRLLGKNEPVIPADVTQWIDNGIPHHAVTNVSDGRIEYASANGNQYKNNKNEIGFDTRSYRFVGTPKDSINWKNEYNQRYKDIAFTLQNNNLKK